MAKIIKLLRNGSIVRYDDTIDTYNDTTPQDNNASLQERLECCIRHEQILQNNTSEQGAELRAQLLDVVRESIIRLKKEMEGNIS